jgi:predicted dehydrogenase
MNDQKLVNVAQIGVGYWGPNLLRNLIAGKNCRVKAVVDLSPDRRDFVKSLYPAVAVSHDPQIIFDDPSIDAVVIATPVETHFDLTMQALAAGKHVLVEKPMAKSVAQIDRIDDLARRNRLVAMVGHTFIYNAAVKFIKRYIDAGELGDIRYIYSQRLNLGRIRSDVDALWNFAPHDVSIIQYLLDGLRPTSVFKQGMQYIQDDVSDVVFMSMIYPHKIMAHVHVSWLDPKRVRQMIIVGSKKMIVYDDVAEDKVAIFDKGINLNKPVPLGKNMDYDVPHKVYFTYRSGDIVYPKIDFEEPLKCQIEHFFDCILNGTPCLTGTRHARTVVEILSWDAAPTPVAQDARPLEVACTV